MSDKTRAMGPDSRSRQQTEAEEIDAIRESHDSARHPVREEPAEPRSAMEVQGDLPGLDDNSRLDNAPGWDKAREIADERPVGAAPGPVDQDEQDEDDRPRAAAFKDAEPAGPAEADVQVRPAGPDSTRDDADDWDEVDESVDESFPASDPPAKY
ncbi:hypothetical protein [Pelagibacterium limicola]|uniref:hypothetical protein n=1 Tax=Pelagibacterium limicola TaxID=2791022 RepID=UPI0018AF581F|nr:hypothetical protein [Pelagibacterium limicola]